MPDSQTTVLEEPLRRRRLPSGRNWRVAVESAAEVVASQRGKVELKVRAAKKVVGPAGMKRREKVVVGEVQN